jgi:hypothetical protein
MLNIAGVSQGFGVESIFSFLFWCKYDCFLLGSGVLNKNIFFIDH